MSDESKPSTEAEAELREPHLPELSEVLAWVGQKLDDMHGSAVGRIDGAYVDEQTARPEWLLVRMGRFGQHTLVPGRDAVAGAGRVWIPYVRDVIRRAPRIKSGSPLAKEQES